MDDLYPIACGQICLGPAVAAHHLLIKFDSNPRRGQRQLRDEIVQRRAFAQFPALAIELNQQYLCPCQEAFGGRMILRNSAVSPSTCAWIRTAARPLSNEGSRIGIAAMP